ncbi:MAG: transglutaminase family protein [Acidimicrobiales bacterium]
MRFDIVFHTTLVYADVVRESYNELRACPANDEYQQVIAFRLSSVPGSRSAHHFDYWGTRVDTFGVRPPHERLDIIAEATVITSDRPVDRPPAVPLSALTDEVFVEEHLDYLDVSPHTEGGSRLADFADGLGGGDVVSHVRSVSDSTHAAIEYASGTTHVGIDLDEVLERGQGVCQDYAHLAVAACRRAGIPARYVSGYLFTADDSTGEDTTDMTVVVETHAWFEAAVPGSGWLALDPTNGLDVGARHVKIGHGRDYDDVPPMRGVYAGDVDSDVTAGVEIRRSAREFIAHSAASRREETAAQARFRERYEQQQQQQQQQ